MLISFASCQPKFNTGSDPRTTLKEYIEKSFNITQVSDRTVLESYLIGPARSRLSAWSADQFHSAFIESKRKYIKFAISETKAVNNSEVNITYELTYSEKGKKESTNESKVTQRKISFLVLKDNRWFIQDVRNIKELIEYQDEMTLP